MRLALPLRSALLFATAALVAASEEPCAAQYAKCGMGTSGQSYTGPTVCCGNPQWVCEVDSEYHSMCIPNTSPSPPGAPPPPPSPPVPFIDFETSGAQILANGAQFHIKGVNWFGFESKDGVLGGLGYQPLDNLLQFLEDNTFNAVRLPLSVSNLVDPSFAMTQAHINSYENSDLLGLTHLELVDEVIARAARHGLLIMLDVHRLTMNDDEAHDAYWYDATYPEAKLIEAWTTLAQR